MSLIRWLAFAEFQNATGGKGFAIHDSVARLPPSILVETSFTFLRSNHTSRRNQTMKPSKRTAKLIEVQSRSEPDDDLLWKNIYKAFNVNK